MRQKNKLRKLSKKINVKRIGFIGGANTGKDTLSHWLFVQLKLEDRTCYYISEMAEQALMKGMNLKTVQGQLWMCGLQMVKETESEAWGKREFIICNRTIIDQAAYSKFLSKDAFKATLEVAKAYLTVAPYDLIFLMHPLERFTYDGVRKETPEEIQKITQSMLEMAELFGKQFDIPIVHIKSKTKKARQKEIMKVIKERYLK
jgi:nicotinamide riboside kinase